MANSNTPVTGQKVVSSLWWKLLERVFSQGINLVVQIVLARLLLPSDFGSLAIIVAITNYAALFVQSGLATAIVQKKELEDEDVSTLLTASLVVAGIFYTILYASAPWIAELYRLPDIIWPLRFLALILFLNALNSIQTALLSRSMDFKTIFLRSVLAVPIAGAIGIGMAYMGYGLWALVTHNLVNMLVVVVVMFFGLDYKLRIGFCWQRAKALYSFSVKILLTSLVSGFSDTVRTMTIGKKYSMSQLAYYDKAYTYSYYVNLIFSQTIQSVLLPVFSRQQDNKDALLSTARRSVSMTAFTMFPAMLGVCVCAKPLVLLLLTEKWVSCVPYLALFCVFRLGGCISSIDKQVYYALGKSHIGLYYEIGLLIANIIVLIVAVPIGVYAIAIGILVVELFGTLALFIVSSIVYHYSLAKRVADLQKPVINTLLMVALIWPMSFIIADYGLLILSQFVLGATIYLILAVLTHDDNLQNVKKLIQLKYSK